MPAGHRGAVGAGHKARAWRAPATRTTPHRRFEPGPRGRKSLPGGLRRRWRRQFPVPSKASPQHSFHAAGTDPRAPLAVLTISTCKSAAKKPLAALSLVASRELGERSEERRVGKERGRRSEVD